MKKSQAIKLFKNEGWTEVDAQRALEVINFKTNPNELTIRRTISSFAGSELIKRQRLLAAQKVMVTKKTKEIERKDEEYVIKINQYEESLKRAKEKYESEIQTWLFRKTDLETEVKSLAFQNNELLRINEQFQKDKLELIKIKEELGKDKNELSRVKEELGKDKNELSRVNEQIKKDKNELFRVNEQLKKDNKDLNNIIDATKLKLTIEAKKLLKKKNQEIELNDKEWVCKINQYENSHKKEIKKYESEIKNLLAQNANLETKVNYLVHQNNELATVNEQLKKDNKDLKNIVDAIKLQLSIDMRKLLQYEDSELRKALIQFLKWMLG